MTQKGGKRRQAPAYSTDTMALRYFAGLLLVAVGVLIFMAVDLGMGNPSNERDFFTGLKRLSFGLSGSLGYVLAAIPLWAGVLVIWSTQRRAPVRSWVFGLLSFAALCTFIMMISGNAMGRLDEQARGSWSGVIGRTYYNCGRTGNGGGALGVVLVYLLWKMVPSGLLWAVIMFLAAAFCLLMMVNLTPRRIRELVTGQAAGRRNRMGEEQAQAEAQQISWQQQQAMQQAAWEQQQQRQIIEQQQMFQDQQNRQYPPAAQQPDMMTETGRRRKSAQDVQEWQEQMTARRTAASDAQAQHQSWIFGKKEPVKTERAEPSRISRIFGKKKQEDDGLIESNEAAMAKAMREAAEAGGRRTVNDIPAQPATRWNTASPAAEEAEVRTAANRNGNRPAQEDRSAFRRPPADTAEEPEAVQQPGRRTGRQKPIRPEAPAYTEEPETPARTAGTRDGRNPRGREETAGRVTPPAVQQTIGDEEFRPKIKTVKPPEPERPADDAEWIPVPYNCPPITDLAMPKNSGTDTSAEDEMRSRKLEETLASFKVQARVVHVTHGPAISRFEMELAAGTKVGNVAKLEKDIAYGMEATSVRIEAPIPGKSLVGVEVPNRRVETVTLREVLQSEKMQSDKPLLVALGKDIAGTPIVCDLAKMPHMLIAGQTGSGKSVCINAIINSLLYRVGPDEVKMILVDPKVVELQCYNGIPHLLIPVVNDPHKAAAALAWAVAEMMERYDKFAERKVRNLDGYNAALKKGEKPMTRIVIIIDELADLMMVCKKDVEEYICRITQLARAAGIHLIVATQRPSVDVITGLIKANIPSRIAFKTASQVDSRTILDRNGSEQLLGWGDMLYLPTGSFAPTRVQGCFLSDEEVNRIVKHVRDANPSTYDPDILEKLEQIANGSAGDMSGADMIGGTGEVGGVDGGLFEQAVEFAISDGQISTSTLQRRLKIGYARAGRLTDEMEERGIVAAKDGSKPRKCLITREEWEEMKKNTGDLM